MSFPGDAECEKWDNVIKVLLKNTSRIHSNYLCRFVVIKSLANKLGRASLQLAANNLVDLPNKISNFFVLCW